MDTWSNFAKINDEWIFKQLSMFNYKYSGWTVWSGKRQILFKSNAKHSILSLPPRMGDNEKDEHTTRRNFFVCNVVAPRFRRIGPMHALTCNLPSLPSPLRPAKLPFWFRLCNFLAESRGISWSTRHARNEKARNWWTVEGIATINRLSFALFRGSFIFFFFFFFHHDRKKSLEFRWKSV